MGRAGHDGDEVFLLRCLQPPPFDEHRDRQVLAARPSDEADVLPQTGLRQWVLTFPFSWRRRLAQDGARLGRLAHIVVEMVQGFYAERAAEQGAIGAKAGPVTAVQRTSSDPRLNDQS